MNEHLSRLDIARSLLGAATDPRLATHAESCERCRRLVGEARADVAQFGASIFPRTLPAIERAAGRRASPWIALLAVPVAVATALLLWLRPHGSSEPMFAAKGKATMQVYAARGDSVIRVHEGTRLGAGDRLRFAVNPGTSSFVLIASLDGRGTASLFFPSTAVASGTTTLPDSIALDDAPGPERVFAVFSDRPLDADSVLEGIRRRGQPPSGSTVVSLSFDKEAPR